MAEKHAVLKQLNGITFVAKGDTNHWIMMDGEPLFGGSEAAPRPKELILFGLAGCTASDVVPILKKKRAPLQNFEMNINAKTSDEHPQVFTDIHLEYVFYGEDIKPADVERAIELSLTKYCSVTAMLRKSVNITHSYRIEKPKPDVSEQPAAQEA